MMTISHGNATACGSLTCRQRRNYPSPVSSKLASHHNCPVTRLIVCFCLSLQLCHEVQSAFVDISPSLSTSTSYTPTRKTSLSFIVSKRIHKKTGYSIEVSTTRRNGWLENFFEPPKSSSSSSREIQYPEQYPATYELNTEIVEEDNELPAVYKLVRPLLRNTQLQSRPLQLVFDANKDGWDPASFHSKVDGKGAAVVIARTAGGSICGGYNPKGWASLGGARPSVAAFLYYERNLGGGTEEAPEFQKLQKVGGGGLACANDDPNYGLSFGPDGLVISLTSGRENLAQSKLGPYFERGPDDRTSIFDGGVAELADLKVVVGRYEDGEDIPYSGGVLDMTSG